MRSVPLSSGLRLPLVCGLAVTLLAACEKRKTADGHEGWYFLGQPKEQNRWKAPTEISDFHALYTRNCLACHSNGPASVSASIAMDNPTFLSIIPEAALREVIANGVPGTLMPGFSVKAGGELTDAQIDILVKGILANKKPAALPLPAYRAPLGNAANGQALFEMSPYAKVDGVAVPPSKSILNPAFLGTISDQYLRTLIIVGLPQLGYPDFRNFVPGRALTDAEVSDVVAWIASNRRNEYGQPISAPTTGQPAVPPDQKSSATQSVP